MLKVDFACLPSAKHRQLLERIVRRKFYVDKNPPGPSLVYRIFRYRVEAMLWPFLPVLAAADMAFDILMLNDNIVMGLSLAKRRKLLERIIRPKSHYFELVEQVRLVPAALLASFLSAVKSDLPTTPVSANH